MATPESLQRPVTIRTYTDEIDDYGQMHTKYFERGATMCLFKYVQSANDPIQYNHIKLIGLSKGEFTDKDNVIYNGQEYKIQYYIYTHRWNVYYLDLYEH